jgi:peptidoglycan/xylan/chitin deacetylase (PgdA/CDA1 family)
MTAALALAACGSEASSGARSNPNAMPSPSTIEVEPAAISSPSPSPTLSVKPGTAKPSTSPRPPAVMNCTGTASSDRSKVSGSGPFGTVIATGSKDVALTFDDGPDPVNTPKVLDLLRQCGVKATFCVNGIKVAAAQSVIRRIHNDGHSFCNHTWRHIRQLGSYGPDLIREDLTMTNDAIKSVVPDAKISYFRAPGGVWTADYVAVARSMGMTPLHWHLDTRDWESSVFGHGQSMVNHLISYVQNEARPGSVILMHDYQKPDTTEALRTIMPWLKARFPLVALPRDGMASP